MARKNEIEEEEPRKTKAFREWKGVVNNSARNALPDDAWWYLENLIPVGNANVQTVNNISNALANYSTHNPYWAQYNNVGGVDYIISFCTDGTVQAYNIVGASSTQIGSGLSGSLSRSAQWKNTELLVVDATGYYNWPGTGTLTLISGTGVPTSGTDIAVAFGRVWILQGRLLTFSGPNDFSAASFTTANGAGSVALTDPTIRNTVTKLSACNGYLYLVSPTGINAISDVYVPSGATPPTPLFTNLNIQAIIGSDQPGSVFPLNQALMFANRYGAWSLYGTNAQKVSTDIDGTWKYLNFGAGISGGQVVVNQILNAAFLVQRQNDPEYGSNTVLAMNFDNKWWFGNYGALTFVTAGIAQNEPALYGFIGGSLYQLYALTTSSPESIASTPLWPMEDPLADKNAIRTGFEVTVSIFNGTFGMTLDTVAGQTAAVNLTTGGQVAWINNALSIVQWQNNALQIVTWNTAEFLLYNGTAPGIFSKYIGATVSASASSYQLSGIYLDYKLGARWN